ncbi:MAG: methyltransferase domain-containing protein [Runella slithyformis]|nr:MAG: methyltransferase domain-containing protein [Runella slithyformis]
MPRPKNPFFRFKQFTIWQDQTALKVCTEACILGAYAAVSGAHRILDIGTGTGLLALMTAQRAPQAQVVGVEIEPNAALQAQQNAQKSPFAARVQICQIPIQDFMPTVAFDLVVCNPPFFNNHLPARAFARQQALHTQTLPFEDLAVATARLLTPDGQLVILLPAYETQLFVQTAQQNGLFPVNQLAVYQRVDAPVFRLITTFGRATHLFDTETLYIHETDGSYSATFKTLLKPYYLHL